MSSCLAVSCNYLFGHLTNFPSHLSIASLGSNFKNACRLIVANEVENLHPVFPWQHLTLSASLLYFSGCSVVLIDLIVRSSSRGQEHI